MEIVEFLAHHAQSYRRRGKAAACCLSYHRESYTRSSFNGTVNGCHPITLPEAQSAQVNWLLKNFQSFPILTE